MTTRRVSRRTKSNRLTSLLLALVWGLVPSHGWSKCESTVILSSASVESLHPLLANLMPGYLATRMLFMPLLAVDKTYHIDQDRSLASRIDVSTNNTVFKITLRPWHWSDGAEVTAEDVLYSWKQISALGKSYKDYGTGGIPNLINNVEAKSSGVVEIVTTRPVNPTWFEAVGLTQIVPLPSRHWNHISLDTQRDHQTDPKLVEVVDGPFKLSSFDPLASAVFVRNDHYDGMLSRSARIVLSFVRQDNALEALQAGEVDLAQRPAIIPPNLSSLRQFQAVSFSKRSSSFLIPNLRNQAVSFFSDPRVRQAIAHSINQQRILTTTFHGQASVQRSFMPTSLTALLPSDLQRKTSDPFYDRQLAEHLLDTAGYKRGPDGVRSRDGSRLAFTALVPSGQEMFESEAQLVQDDLTSIGIAMQIRSVDVSQLMARMFGPARGWEAVLYGYSWSSYPDASEFFSSHGGQNMNGFSSAQLDDLLDRSERSDDKQALFAAERLTLEQQPFIFLPESEQNILASPKLTGLREAYSGDEFRPEKLAVSEPASCHQEAGVTTPHETLTTR